ncbi:MAG: hypothetical protein AMXMBFR6_19750 [Betaproteobacteria bacterium]
MQMESARLRGRHASRILPAMLKNEQAVVQELANRSVCHDAEYAAHGLYPKSSNGNGSGWRVRPADMP